MGATAHDLLKMKTTIEDNEKEEIKKDLSNVVQGDSFEETVFKIFE